MSVTVRRYDKKNRPTEHRGWEVDINVLLPTGRRHRERRKAPTASRSAAKRWGEARERDLLVSGPLKPQKEVPTLTEFASRFVDGYARANRQKPSGIAAKETILRIHLEPRLGSKKLDAIGNEDVQQVKAALRDKSPKTVNNVLTVLNTLLKRAVEWGVIDRMPCSVRLVKTPKPTVGFHDFAEYERLVVAAKQDGANAHLIALLGGDAGLRCGEMMALEWRDVDLTKRQLCIQRAEWKGQVTAPKGGRHRFVPLTARLAEALRQYRHLRSPRVLCHSEGRPLTQNAVYVITKRIAAGAAVRAGVHILRHTFCSHLAMRGVPARAIQELAGHTDLSTTQRYMHLSPAALDQAIALLETRSLGVGTWRQTGDGDELPAEVVAAQ